MPEFSTIKVVIVFAVTFVVSFVGASTGGSAMFTVPLCIFLGFPVHVAVATTRFSAFFLWLELSADFQNTRKLITEWA